MICCGSDHLNQLFENQIVPVFSTLIYDRTASVRHQLIVTITRWFLEFDTHQISDFESSLFTLLISLVNDEQEENQVRAISAMNDLGRQKWMLEQDQAQEENRLPTHDNVQKQDQNKTMTGGYFPFTTRPHPGARAKAQDLLSKVLPVILEGVTNWTVPIRIRSIASLKVLGILVEDAIDPFVGQICDVCAKLCRDDEVEVIRSLREAVAVLGRYADGTLFIVETLVPLISGRVLGKDSLDHRCNGLTLLSMSIQGMNSSILREHLDTITQTLAAKDLLYLESPVMHEILGDIVQRILDVMTSSSFEHQALSFRLFMVLNQIIASTPDTTLAHQQVQSSFENTYRQESDEMTRLTSSLSSLRRI